MIQKKKKKYVSNSVPRSIRIFWLWPTYRSVAGFAKCNLGQYLILYILIAYRPTMIQTYIIGSTLIIFNMQMHIVHIIKYGPTTTTNILFILIWINILRIAQVGSSAAAKNRRYRRVVWVSGAQHSDFLKKRSA